ncbi:flavin reductase family protein [Capnocytophaga ochracea]|jgi:flavin reductase domain protein FMN-binding|uniref:flavin reductase family protein n=1 Tax=Capnocytophaga ochracea TaxID=1018 RepID=UPI000660D94B|nr:flavin reductase family protein [Capnocytophaga ochracea]MEB3016957.1 flavin reductase family protein [Capnocytophaga ochracea]MEB3036648.1 flavin reductase family protein [Capnocytophaga ochracea]
MKSFLPTMFYYGFPVVLLTTTDKDGNADVTPISSTFTLGANAVIALVKLNKAYHNVMEVPEVVFNLPTVAMWEKVEAIAPYTAQNPVPPQKMGKYTYTDDKFSIGGFTQLPSEKVRPPRIAECPIQAEAKVKNVNDRDAYVLVELEFVQVHAEDHLVMEGNKINPLEWEPLIYNFKHYYGLGEHKGLNFSIK